MNFAQVLLNNPAPPDKAALITQQGDLTYGDLVQRAQQFANFLMSQGVKPGDRILLAGESSAMWVQGYLGCALAGAVAVPVAVPITDDYLSEIMKSVEPAAALVQAKWLRRLDSQLAGCKLIISEARPPRMNADLNLVTLEEMLPSDNTNFPQRNEDDLAAIMFTSGSTAAPRGVMISHGNIIANTTDIIASMNIDTQDRIMAVLPFHYCFGTSLLHTHLMAGASLVIDNRFLFPEKVLQNMIDTQCTSLAGVPSTYQILLRRSNLKKMKFPHLKKLQQAGGKLAGPFIEELEEALPDADLFVMYGQTEATARLSCISPQDRQAHPHSIGKGLDQVQLKVVNESGQPVSEGQTGEIVALGPNIASGYWENPEATARIFTGGLHTGDLAQVDSDGYICIVDRARDFIKCGGKRVSCKQIEASILHFPDLTEAAVVGIPDLVLGEAVCLFVVHPQGELIAEELEKFCKTELDHTLLPKRIVYLPDMPRNNSGKLDKRALKLTLTEISEG